MKPVAGLDLSLTAAGVAIIGRQRTTYTFGEKLSKNASDRVRIERNINIANDIMGVLIEHRVRFVGVENYAFGAYAGLAQQADLGGLVKAQIYLCLKTVPIVLPPTTIRKYLLGDGGADKKKVRIHLESLGCEGFRNLDESDAMAVAFVVNDYVNNRAAATTTQQLEVFDRIDKHQGLSR